eukprot:COSAG01_NODE_28952_length_648_cov_7.030790_2_plen_71_part_01
METPGQAAGRWCRSTGRRRRRRRRGQVAAKGGWSGGWGWGWGCAAVGVARGSGCEGVRSTSVWVAVSQLVG